MKKTLLMSALLLGVAACGGGSSGDKQALLKSCEEDGSTSKEACSCIVDSMEKELSPALFKKVAKASAESGTSPEDMMGDLSAEEQGEFMNLVPAMMTCAMEDAGVSQ